MSDEAVMEAPVEMEAIETPAPEQQSFELALEAALNKLDAPEPTPEPEAKEPAPEPTSEEPAQSEAKEPAPEPSSEELAQPESEEPAPEPESEETPQPDSEESDTEETKEEKPYDPTDEIEVEDTSDWTPKAARRFKQLKEERKVLRSEVEDLRQKTKEYESKIEELSGSIDNEDIQSMRDQLAEYEQQRMYTDLENTTAYKEAVTEPIHALLERAEQVADHYDIDPDSLVDVISMEEGEAQDEALSNILDGVSDRDKAKIYRVIEDINPILSYREELINNLEKAYNEAQYLEEQKQKEESARKAQERESITKNVIGRVREKVPFLDGFENMNFEEITQKASEKDPGVMHPVDSAYQAVAAQLLPTMIREYSALQAEIDNLTDRLAEYEEAEPGTSGSSPDSASTARTSGSDVSFEDAISRRLSGLT